MFGWRETDFSGWKVSFSLVLGQRAARSGQLVEEGILELRASDLERDRGGGGRRIRLVVELR